MDRNKQKLQKNKNPSSALIYFLKNYFQYIIIFLFVVAIAAGFKWEFAHATGPFNFISTFGGGVGLEKQDAIGPGPNGTRRYYMAYQYYQYPFQLVAIDPDNLGDPNSQYQSYVSPVSSENGAFALVKGPDNNMYLGTEPNGHLMKFDGSAQTLSDLGTFPNDPTSGKAQQYIWQLSVSAYNNLIYGCTYPNDDVVTYDTTTGVKQNLGTLDSTGKNLYAHYCVGDTDPTQPYLYLGTGSVASSVMVWNINTGRSSATTLFSGGTGFGHVGFGTDGKLYGSTNWGNAGGCYVQLSKGGVVTSLPSSSCTITLSNGTSAPGYLSCKDNSTQPCFTEVTNVNVFSNGDTISVTDPWLNPQNQGSVNLQGPTCPSGCTYPYAYKGGKMGIYRMGLGPNNDLYISSAFPAYLANVSLTNTPAQFLPLGGLGLGQLFSLLPNKGNEYLAGYVSIDFGMYNPSQSWNNGTNPLQSTNSQLANDLRSESILYSAADNKIYVGNLSGYGTTQGNFTYFDANNINNATVFLPTWHQGVSTMTNVTDATTAQLPGIVMGTSIYAGSGDVNPDTPNSAIILWDSTKESRISYLWLNKNTPGVSNVITNTIDFTYSPSTGYVLGLGSTDNSATWYVIKYSPYTNTVVETNVPFSCGAPLNPVPLGAAVGYDGNIWGLTTSGVFKINTSTWIPTVTCVASSPVPITAGFAMDPTGHTMYFSSKTDVYSYTLP